jgi:hypothetical protein
MSAAVVTMPMRTLALGCALVAFGCRKPDRERQATAHTERIAQETTITSGDLSANDAADDEALRDRAEALAAFRREQLDMRRTLQRRIDRLDDEVAAKHPEQPEKVTALTARRQLLKADMDSLDRSTEDDWPALETKIDRDISASNVSTRGAP